MIASKYDLQLTPTSSTLLPPPNASPGDSMFFVVFTDRLTHTLRSVAVYGAATREEAVTRATAKTDPILHNVSRYEIDRADQAA